MVIHIFHLNSDIWNVLFPLPVFLIFPLSLLCSSLNTVCPWCGDFCGRGAFILLGVLSGSWNGRLVSVIHFRRFLHIISSYHFFLACQSYLVRSFIYISLGCSAVFSLHAPSFPTVLQISARTVMNLVYVCVRLTKGIWLLLSPLFFSKPLWVHPFKGLFSAILGS